MRPLRSLACVLALLTLAACSDDDAGSAPLTADAGADGRGGDGGSGGGSGAGAGGNDAGSAPGWKKAFKEGGAGIRCAMTAAEMRAREAPALTFGDATIFVGFEQIGQNQDPVFARFDGDTKTYCEHHEREGPDGRALGITWDGGPTAYVVYTIVGGGSAFDAMAKGGWLERYGDGGGSSKVSFLGIVETGTGRMTGGTFVIAKKNDGKTNTHNPTDAPTRLEDGRVELRGSSAFQPMNPDRSIMECTNYPFDTRYVFAPDLKTLLCSTSTNCTAAVPCP